MNGTAKLLAVAILAAFLQPSLVLGQSATPTATQTATLTPTKTPTQTPTITPVKNVGLMVWRSGCATAPTPCSFPDVIRDAGAQDADSGGGRKTVVCKTEAGTATTQIICKPAPDGPEVIEASMSGAACPTPSNCVAEFTHHCDDMFARITACTSCEVSCQYRIDPR